MLHPLFYTALRSPVPIEVIPVFRMRADARAELAREILRRLLNRLVARTVAVDGDRPARLDLEAAGTDALHETGQQRRAGHESHQHRRAQEPRAAAEELDLDAVAADVTVHQDRHDPVLRESSADLQRGIERLADLDRLDADEVADLAPQAIDLGIRLRHGDDRDRLLHDAAQEDAARLPVAVVPADEDDAAPLRPQIDEQLLVGRRVRKQCLQVD